MLYWELQGVMINMIISADSGAWIRTEGQKISGCLLLIEEACIYAGFFV